MNHEKQTIHFVDSKLLNSQNPVEIVLIGAGGTGSNLLPALARISHSLNALGHAGLNVTLWDDDLISESNCGRQLFATSEIGLYKSVALVNRINRFFGTEWKAVTKRFCFERNQTVPKHTFGSIYISCVDNIASRFEIAEILGKLKPTLSNRNQPRYWMDFGNGRDSGQVILSTIGEIKQPESDKYATVGNLPFVTEEYKELLLLQSVTEKDTPSCSHAEALQEQDLFINSSLAQLGGSLLWKMFSGGMIKNKGFFLNLDTSVSNPIALD